MIYRSIPQTFTAGDNSGADRLLSTAHKGPEIDKARRADTAKSPFVEWHTRASILKVSKSEPQVKRGGGLRGTVKGFSRGSRRRLMSKIAKIDRRAMLPAFVTLTYPDSFPEPRESKKHLKVFVKRLRREFPSAGLIWKLEPQQRGAPHYHLLVWGCEVGELRTWVPQNWYEIGGGGDIKHLLWHEGKLGNGNKHCTQQVHSFRGVWAYAAKYLGKTFEIAGWDSKAVGRFWAVVSPVNIPFGELQVRELPRADAVAIMRYQKRFAKLKSRDYPSLTIFCDSEQWVDKLIDRR